MHRTFLLSGLLVCACGKPLHGQTRSSRGREWRYYLCRHCDASAIRADEAEDDVLERLRAMLLPPAAVERARDELRRRLALPSRGLADERRSRLEARIQRLKAQFEWGDIAETEYRAKMADTRAQLVLLPESDKVVAFDDAARIVSSLDAAIGEATLDQLKELIRLVVARVTTADRAIASIEIVPAALPFFAPLPTLLTAPPDGLGGTVGESIDPLDWYARQNASPVTSSEVVARRHSARSQRSHATDDQPMAGKGRGGVNAKAAGDRRLHP